MAESWTAGGGASGNARGNRGGGDRRLVGVGILRRAAARALAPVGRGLRRVVASRVRVVPGRPMRRTGAVARPAGSRSLPRKAAARVPAARADGAAPSPTRRRADCARSGRAAVNAPAGHLSDRGGSSAPLILPALHQRRDIDHCDARPPPDCRCGQSAGCAWCRASKPLVPSRIAMRDEQLRSRCVGANVVPAGSTEHARWTAACSCPSH
jgi:hypothetical protein